MKKAFLFFAFAFSMLFSLPGGYGYAASYEACVDHPAEWRDVSGEWVASVGPVILEVNGRQVTGVYNQDTWSLELEYSEDFKGLYGTWSHRNGPEGPVIFRLDDNGCIRHATWGGVGRKACTPKDFSACTHDWAFHGRALKP